MKPQQKTGMILFIIMGTFIIFINSDRMTEKMPIGSLLPKIDFIQGKGDTSLKNDSLKSTIVIWFNPECEHCQYQLKSISEHLNEFQNTRFIFLTDDNKYMKYGNTAGWQTLATSSDTDFKTVSTENFSKFFGKAISPSLYLFDKNDRLRHKFYGEVKAKKILQLIADLDVPEHTDSGYN